MRTKIFSGLYGENSAVINDNNLSFEEVLDLYMRNVQPLGEAPSNAAVLHIRPQASDEEVLLFNKTRSQSSIVLYIWNSLKMTLPLSTVIQR
jgi:hypothetical protein